jgi:transcriptional regulator with XRE-family HTH domain
MSTSTNAQRIGARLRGIRHQQDLSLADVEQASEGRWKAVVVGAYERGDRAVSVSRLAQLAEFYGVPLADILPGAETETAPEGHRRVTLDLTALAEDDDAAEDDEVGAVARFAQQVQRRRGDHNGRMLSLRGDDLEMLALAVGTTREALLQRLDARGALLGSPTAA